MILGTRFRSSIPKQLLTSHQTSVATSASLSARWVCLPWLQWRWLFSVSSAAGSKRLQARQRCDERRQPAPSLSAWAPRMTCQWVPAWQRRMRITSKRWTNLMQASRTGRLGPGRMQVQAVPMHLRGRTTSNGEWCNSLLLNTSAYPQTTAKLHRRREIEPFWAPMPIF